MLDVTGTDVDRGDASAGRAPRALGRLFRPHGPQNLRRRAIFGRLWLLLAIVVVWEVATNVGLLDRSFLPSPLGILGAAGGLALDPGVAAAIAVTGWSIMVAFILGAVAGIVLGTLVGLSRRLRDAYLAPLLFLMSMPKVVFLPIFVLMFGLGADSAIAFAAFEAAVYVAVLVVDSMDMVEQRHLRVAHAFRASRWQRFAAVVFPSALPGIFTSLWFCIKYAFAGVLTAELWASSSGVGALIRVYTQNLQTERVFALLFAVSTLVVLVGIGWNTLEARLTRWRSTSRVTATAVPA